MVEIKSVKVDNWGVFFLQKLQNFFNKTDYCDLTLQFKDNSQLKVHRLVLSACTDFFNVLENRYAVHDDILIMPKDLQADVVVPIVNFMYTGTLEFEVNMYPRLLKTAKEMNMTVLLKLLDAHKRTVGEAMRTQQPAAPVLLNKGATGNQRVNTYSRPSPSQKTYQQVKKTTPSSAGVKTVSPRGGYQVVKGKQEKSPIRPIASTSFIRKNLPEPVQLVAKYANSPGIASIKGPSRFECSDEVNSDAFESSFDNISYESKPLITSKDDHEVSFDQIKRTVATKRPFASTASTVTPPPEKKPNIEDVKEYTEAARLRKEIESQIVAQEIGEDQEYYEDDFHNDDDDEENENENTSVVVKSESGSNVNHAKLLSEVVKRYPHLLKNNKNIKLKILQKGNSPVTVSAIAKDPSVIASSKQQAAAKQARPITVQAKIPAKTEVTSKATAQAAKPTTSTPTAQPKKIDSRTMHALIAKGAENTTGPWLCLECGVDGRPISIPSYRGFRRHLVNIHKQKIDPRLCEHCGHRSIKRNDLHYHLLIKHEIQPPQDLHFPKCGMCTFIALDQTALKRHRDEDHQSQSSQQHCIYCNKTFQKENQLYTHMRNHHRERAVEDGVIDFSDEETYEDEADKYVPNHPEVSQATGNVTGSKIKVLSNITLPSKSSFVIDSQSGSNVLVSTSTHNINLEPSSEAEGLSNVASGIATSLAVLDTNAQLENVETYEDDLQTQYIEAAMADVHGEILKKDDEATEVVTKFITEEGSELELTAAQKARLLEQLQDQSGNISDNVVMVLEDTFEQQSQDGNNVSAESMELGDDGKPENESTEWDESHQEQSDDPLKNDDSIGGGTEDEEMASTENENENENASIDEDSQGGESVNEQEIANDTGKENSDKSSNKLISALEGDWTEEDDEAAEEPAATNESEESGETEKTNAKTSKQSEDVKTDKTNENKDLILEDWDSQQGDKNDSIDDEKIETDENVKIVEDKTAKTVESDSKNIAGPAVGDKKQLAQKNELKTLINDWGDEDDDGF